MRAGQQLNRGLFQVMVIDTQVGHEVPIGPRMDREEPLLELAAATNLAIQAKRITGWKDAHVVPLQRTTN